MRWLVAVVVWSGCYAPHPHPGAPCADGECPSGLICSPATSTCELQAVNADGAIQDARADAPLSDTPGDALAGPMLLQEVTNQAASGDTLTITLATPTSGHVLVMIGAAPAGPLTSVTGGGTTWTKAAASYVNANAEIWVGVTDGSSGIVTIERTTNSGEIKMAVSEWSGLRTTNLVDAFAVDDGIIDPVSAGSISTSASDLVLFTASAFDIDPFGTPTPGTWTAMTKVSTTLITQAAWYRVEPSTATLAPTVSRTGGDWDAAIVALRVGP